MNASYGPDTVITVSQHYLIESSAGPYEVGSNHYSYV